MKEIGLLEHFAIEGWLILKSDFKIRWSRSVYFSFRTGRHNRRTLVNMAMNL
jgi:hypothetical protein